MGDDVPMRVRPSARRADTAARATFLAAALSVFAVLGFILWVLATNTVAFFADGASLWGFLTGTQWAPAGTVARSAGEVGVYGVLPLLYGTLLVTVGAAIIGVPLGLGTAIYLAEYAGPRVRALLKPVLEILAGIPSIVFGFFAVTVIGPWFQDATRPGTFLHDLLGEQAINVSAFNAIIVVGIMVLPIVTSLSDDALRAVPRHLREASYGVGATKWETTRKVVVPAALSGITASFVLGIARAIGETMAVTMAAGSQPYFPHSIPDALNPVHQIQTMTAFIVQKASGDLPQEGPGYLSLFAVGMTLFVLTLGMNLLAQRFVRRYREAEA